jgi:pyridoxal phosphate enzyme (YggS family)
MIEAQFRQLQARVRETCQHVGRFSEEVQIVLVTKGVKPPRLLEAYQAGVRDFGESRVQEFETKRSELPKDIRWHFVGHLQTNKVKQIVGKVTLIHSCDRSDLAEVIQKEAEKKGETVSVLIQVNTTGEITKQGFFPEEMRNAVGTILKLSRIQVLGLMTIGPLTENQDEIRKSFKSLRQLKEKLKTEFKAVDWRYLSMGMSGDFEIAIQEGANLIRVGTAVFGPRGSKSK